MLYINGRFLTQPVSGVQRYARELLNALDGRISAEVLVPEQVAAPQWKTLRLRIVPGARGHLWDQTSLLRASRTGRLLSLANSGPIGHRDHFLCLHDAHLYEMPQAFSRPYRLLHRNLRPALSKRAKQLITVSTHSAEALAFHLQLDPSSFEIVSNAAEHVHRWPKTPNIPEKYGLKTGDYLLSVGNQSPNKNLSALIQAHGATDAAMPPLVLVGGPAPGVAQARSRGAISLGRVPDADLRGLYEGAAAFVFPSLNEGFGIPPLEAMELGTPVLCARSGAMPEVLGKAPLWFDPTDVSDMARALEAFHKFETDERNKMRARGLAVARRYRWAETAGKLVALLQADQSAIIDRAPDKNDLLTHASEGPTRWESKQKQRRAG